MNKNRIDTLTPEGARNLSKELDSINKSITMVQKEIVEAKAKGDFSENFELKEASERLVLLQIRRNEVIEALHAPVAIPKISDSISFGVNFILLDIKKEKELKFQLVSSSESNILIGKIDINGNFGKVLLGKKIGEIVGFNNNSYKIIKIG